MRYHSKYKQPRRIFTDILCVVIAFRYEKAHDRAGNSAYYMQRHWEDLSRVSRENQPRYVVDGHCENRNDFYCVGIQFLHGITTDSYISGTHSLLLVFSLLFCLIILAFKEVYKPHEVGNRTYIIAYSLYKHNRICYQRSINSGSPRLAVGISFV